VAIQPRSEAPLFDLYLHDLLWLASSMVGACESVFAQTPVPPPGQGMYIQVAPEIHAQISGVLGDAARLGRLVFPSPKRHRNESAQSFAMKQTRGRALQELLAGIDMPHVRDATARNSVEHFDERLDAANAAGRHVGRGTFAAFNMVLSHREAFAQPILPIRVYIAAERVFLNLAWSANLEQLHAEGGAVLARLRDIPGASMEPGGLMIAL